MEREPGEGVRGDARIEIAAVALMLACLGAVLAPVLARAGAASKKRAQEMACLSNLKQLARVTMMYAQDYDELLPPAYSRVSPGLEEKTRVSLWGGEYRLPETGQRVSSCLSPYLKSQDVFRCPRTPAGTALSYLYSDLAAGQPLYRFGSPANTVLIAEGTPIRQREMAAVADNPAAAPAPGRLVYGVGHALAPRPLAAVGVGQRKQIRRLYLSGGYPGASGEVIYSWVTAVSSAPVARAWDAAARADVYRHDGLGCFAHVDGHIRRFKPGQVFFPDRGRGQEGFRDPRQGALGPNPAGGMTFRGRAYASTFHIR